MEPVVLDKGLDIVLVHKAVVLFRAVSCIGDGCGREFAVTPGEGLQERNEGKGVRGIGEQAEVRDVLILCPYLQIVPRFGLSVVHGILLHTHEGSILVSLGTGVSLTDCFELVVILY